MKAEKAVLSIYGGVFGLVLGAFLLRFEEPGAGKHARMIIAASVASLLLYAVLFLKMLALLSPDIVNLILVSSFVLSAILGAYLAHRKGDFITRGFFFALLTSVWGVIILLFAPPSEARSNKRGDAHYWPKDSWIALVLLSNNIAAFIIAGNLVSSSHIG
jgi:hypothetical protein